MKTTNALRERNCGIVTEYQAGISQRKLAVRYGLSRRQIQRVIGKAGVSLSVEEVKDRRLKGLKAKTIFGSDPAKRRDYLTFRSKVGAVEARRIVEGLL